MDLELDLFSLELFWTFKDVQHIWLIVLRKDLLLIIDDQARLTDSRLAHDHNLHRLRPIIWNDRR